MREQINLVIDADVARLDASLPPIRARAGCEFVARVHGVPADCGEVVFRVFRGEAFYDFPATCNANGEWTCRLLPVAFDAESAEGLYEVRAVSADGQNTAIGGGRVLVGPWSRGAARTFDARRRFVSTIFDEEGGQHAIWAVQNSVGEWTYKIGPVGEAEAVPLNALPAAGDATVDIRAVVEE